MNKLMLFVSLVACVSSSKIDYSNYKIIASENGHDLAKIIDASSLKIDYQVVNEDRSVLMVAPALIRKTFSLLQASNVPFTIVTHDLQKDIEAEAVQSADWFKAYHNFTDQLKWLDQITKNNLKYCSLQDIGKSYLGNPLRVLKITGKPNQCKNKPAIWIDSGIHAREWITHATNSYIIDRLLKDYSTDKEVKMIRDTYDWYFLLNHNPDGYIHSWEKDRLWRKSRLPANPLCVGTDLNRNFDHHWNEVGTSQNPCAQTYAGPKAASDVETQSVSKFLLSKKGQWDIFNTLHSYGHYLLTPWGYTAKLPPTFKDLETLGNATVKAIESVNGIKFKFGAASVVLYPTSGTNDDFAFGVARIPFAYTFELRNKNSFVIPPSEIIPSGKEIYAGIKAQVKQAIITRPPTCKN